jgi:hypothetical protein
VAAAVPTGFVTRSGSDFSVDGKPFVIITPPGRHQYQRDDKQLAHLPQNHHTYGR